MPRTLLVLAMLTAVGAAAACSDPLAPADTFELPPPDLSLDPERLAVGEYIATPCAFGIRGDRLAHLRDRQEWALVDIYFGRESPETSPTGPTEQDVALVTSHGGRVLYRFNVPAVRARIVLSRIPGLVEEGFWVTVREVPDATRYDVPSLSVGFARPIDDSDVALYEELGGRVEYRWESIDALSGVLPDRSIPALRDRSDVEYVEAGSVGCVG
jgi:hypothetical protein